MWKDKIVDDLHRVRRAMLKECGGDMHKLFEAAREWARLNPERMADPSRIGMSEAPKRRKPKPQPLTDALLKDDAIMGELRAARAEIAKGTFRPQAGSADYPTPELGKAALCPTAAGRIMKTFGPSRRSPRPANEARKKGPRS